MPRKNWQKSRSGGLSLFVIFSWKVTEDWSFTPVLKFCLSTFSIQLRTLTFRIRPSMLVKFELNNTYLFEKWDLSFAVKKWNLTYWGKNKMPLFTFIQVAKIRFPSPPAYFFAYAKSFFGKNYESLGGAPRKNILKFPEAKTEIFYQFFTDMCKMNWIMNIILQSQGIEYKGFPWRKLFLLCQWIDLIWREILSQDRVAEAR